MNKSYFRMLVQGGLVVKELNIDDTIIRKGTLREKYSVKEKKLVNNILHYVIKSNTSSDIILSEYAIEKDFITTEQIAKEKEKSNFVKSFKKQITKLLPIKTR